MEHLCVQSTVQDTWGITISKTKIPILSEINFQWMETDNKQ